MRDSRVRDLRGGDGGVLLHLVPADAAGRVPRAPARLALEDLRAVPASVAFFARAPSSSAGGRPSSARSVSIRVPRRPSVQAGSVRGRGEQVRDSAGRANDRPTRGRHPSLLRQPLLGLSGPRSGAAAPRRRGVAARPRSGRCRQRRRCRDRVHGLLRRRLRDGGRRAPVATDDRGCHGRRHPRLPAGADPLPGLRPAGHRVVRAVRAGRARGRGRAARRLRRAAPRASSWGGPTSSTRWPRSARWGCSYSSRAR